jgi:hypothetical protein
MRFTKRALGLPQPNGHMHVAGRADSERRKIVHQFARGFPPIIADCADSVRLQRIVKPIDQLDLEVEPVKGWRRAWIGGADELETLCLQGSEELLEVFD